MLKKGSYFIGLLLLAVTFFVSQCSEEEIASGQGSVGVFVNEKTVPEKNDSVGLSFKASLCTISTPQMIEVRNLGRTAITYDVSIEPTKSNFYFPDGKGGRLLRLEKRELNGGAIDRISVFYKPSNDTKSAEDEATIKVSENTGKEFLVKLEGYGTKDGAPDWCCEGSLGDGREDCKCKLKIPTNPVVFNTTAKGVTSYKQMRLYNDGPKQCEISAISDIVEKGKTLKGEFTFVNKPNVQTTPIYIDPQKAVDIKMAYKPQDFAAGDTDSATLSITEKSTANVIEVTLQAKSVEKPVCNLFIQPRNVNLLCKTPGPNCADAYLDFGQMILGSKVTKNLKIENIGSGDCNFLKAELKKGTSALPLPSSQSPVNYKIGAGVTSTIMAPGDILRVPVELEAVAVGNLGSFGFMNPNTMRLQAWIYTNSPQQSVYKGMTGSAPSKGVFVGEVTGVVAQATIEVVPGEVDFGKVTLGCFSDEKCVKIYNSGSADLSLKGLKVSYKGLSSITPVGKNPFRITKAPVFPVKLAGGSSQEVCFRFTPVDGQGVHQGEAILTSDDPKQKETKIPLKGEGTTDSKQTDNFWQMDKPRVDVLFVVDNSGSMGNDQNNLKAAFKEFIQKAESSTTKIDYQIGVISTEGNRGPFAEKPGQLVSKSGAPHIIKPGSQAVTQFQSNAGLGTRGSATEQGLLAAKMALTKPLKDKAPNKGFLRNDPTKPTKLSIIVVSDEEDSSPGPVDLYVNTFRTIKGFRNTSMLSFMAIVTDNQCSGSGAGTKGNRYIDTAKRIDPQTPISKKVKSICTNNWGKALAELGVQTFGFVREFSLSRPADPTSITVTIKDKNGTTVYTKQCASNPGSCEYEYDPKTNSVVFKSTSTSLIKKGAKISVSYGVPCYDINGNVVKKP